MGLACGLRAVTLALPALAATAAVWAFAPTISVPPPAPVPTLLAAPEAGPMLVLFRRNADASIEVLADGTDAQPGDLVQAAYVAAGNLHGVIVSFDGGGSVTLHHPDESDETTRLHPRTMTPLDHSFELDDAPDFERFVFISTRDHDMDVSDVLQAATRVAHAGPRAIDARLALPSTWVQTSFVLRKPPAPRD